MRWLLVFIICFCASCATQEIANRNSTGESIVCFGDSFTAGYGAFPGEDYPSMLQKKMKTKVINAGQSGSTTYDGLLRLDEYVLVHHPKMVIVTLGANDFLLGMPQADTLKNLGLIFDRILASGAMIVWTEIGTGLQNDASLKDYRILARQKKVLLVDNVIDEIMKHSEYKSDLFHPNAKGYALIADGIYGEIKDFVK